MKSKNSSNKVLIGLVVIVLLVAATTAVIVFTGGNNNTTTNDTTQTTASTSVSPSASTTVSTSVLKDGTYSATGSYQTPGGQESIGVTVTLADGTITNASVTQKGKTGEAQEFQAAFVSGFKSQVVGKKITDISLSRVAGSSLTPNGFNSAIDDIEKQAQA